MSPPEAQPEFEYSSSDETIVLVDNKIVTGIKSGSAEIVVSADGVEKRIGVTVEEKAQGKPQDEKVKKPKETPQAPKTSPGKQETPLVSDTPKPKDETNDNINQEEQKDTITKQEEPKSDNE